ncbi:P-loop NTPase fold protein [Pseudoalteromonas rhizosphaerae]|uniref:P-loop NTPase fold protein n=1 Tax=Pseudoalteromonas rhizosphaerae TaxID=2518973 RepID=A0ABW8L2T6_9GAMM
MSQSLPIPAQRWLSLLLCAITAAAITVFLSNVSFVRQAYASWGSILYANSVLHYSFAFLSGIGIKLMLDKFYISHAKRSIGFNWRYPPVTISVLFGLLFIVVYVYVTNNEIEEQLTANAFVSFKFLSLSFLAVAATIIYQTKLYTKNPIFSVVLCSVSAFYLFSAINLVEIEHAFCVFFFIAAAYLGMSIYLLSEQLRVSNKELIVESKQKVEFKFESLEHFQKWFKDDLPVQSTTELEPDLQVYAQRITERLLTGGDKEGYERKGAQHIALCGPFGCGKSSIVAAIANELKKPKKIEAGLSDEEKLKVEQQNKINWIYSDISTWGAASGSVAHVILSNIIDDISQHIDMCAFRALPKHYTEALKSGGSLFQFASTLLAGPVDIEESFKKLNDVLEATNHKLLITLQDVDRGTGDENEKRLNDIAALLDRLKNKDLSNINFIIAMGNENDIAAEVISKATDYREDIAALDCLDWLNQYTKLCLENALKPNRNRKIESYKIIGYWGLVKLDEQCKGQRDSLSSELKKLEISTSYINSHLNSFRVLKKVLRRVEQAWQPEKLMGEVNFISLMMVVAFREVYPIQYSRYQKLSTKENLRLHRWFDPESFDLKIKEICKSNNGAQDGQLKQYLEHMLRIDWRENDEESQAQQKVAKELEKMGSTKEASGSVTIESNAINNIKLNPFRLEIDCSYIKTRKGCDSANLIMNPKFNYLQSVGCTNSAVNYLDRIQRELLSIKKASKSTELSDQVLIAKVIELRESKDLLEFLEKWFELDSDYRLGVERFFFIPHCCDDLKKGIAGFFESSSCDRDSNFQDFSKSCDIELSIAWLVAESLTLENLNEVFSFFFNRIKGDNQIPVSEERHILFRLIDEVMDLLSSTSEPTNIKAFFRGLNQIKNESDYSFLCLYLISCTKEWSFDNEKKCFKFDISDIQIAEEKLSILLGVDPKTSLEIPMNPNIRFNNALRLNEAIERKIKPYF